MVESHRQHHQPLCLLLSALGFGVLLSGLETWSASGLQGAGFGVEAPGFRFQVGSFKFQVAFGFRASGFQRLGFVVLWFKVEG